MHSWFRTLILPASGITISFGTSPDNSQQRRPASPMKLRSQNASPTKQWSPSMLATTLVVADQFVNDSTSTPTIGRVIEPDIRNVRDATSEMKWTAGCNPLRSASCTSTTQVAPYEEEEEADDVEVDNNLILNAVAAASSLSPRPEHRQEQGTLSANVSSSQLEELVMKKSSRDPHAPLVVLFGWAGCRDRYLAKYSTYYQKEGFAVARFTVPIIKIRSFSSYRKFALEIYEKILEQEPNRPIVFHVFSMNGASLFTALWDLLDSVPDGAEIKKRVKGLIFDSAPANVLPWQAATAVSLSMFPPGKSSSVPREAYRVALAGIFSIHRGLVWLQSNFNPQSYEKHFSYFRLLRFEDLPKNQLFLYSDADNICVKESIEDFLEAQRKRQVNIRAVCWTDSEHCQHYRRYETDYTKSCLEFAKEALK